NLSTAQSHYFSVETTPAFCVADAVRISMSFPFAFKPVLIPKRNVLPPDLAGYWIDGGVLNNIPIHAFDNPVTHELNPNVFGLRLGIDPPTLMTESTDPKQLLGDFLTAFLELYGGIGERSQVRTKGAEDQTLMLQVPRGLSTLNFAP